MENNYDLTTNEGMKKASVILASGSLLGSLIQTIVKPFTLKNTTEEQVRMAKELMKYAKEIDAKEINVTVDESAGLKLKEDIFTGMDVDIGSSNKMTFNCKLK